MDSPGRDFRQSPMDSFVLQRRNLDRSSFDTPMKDNNAPPPSAPSNNNNPVLDDGQRKATKYDYLDYGNYLNRLLSSSQILFGHGGGGGGDGVNGGGFEEIHWNMPRVSDKVMIINAMLAMFEQKKMYESLLQQSRGTIEHLKIDLHSHEMRIKAMTQENKQLNSSMNNVSSRRDFLESELKKQTFSFKEKLKTVNKENENLRYKEKKYANDLRKREKQFKAQQEKIKKLLDDRDKKSYKCLGFKLLNTTTATSSLVPNKNKKETSTTTTTDEQQQQHIQRMMEENCLLQSQIAHFQKQLQNVLGENNLLRESLHRMEVNCKESLCKINDLFANNRNQIQGINKFKYAMPFDKDTQNLVQNDIHDSMQHLSAVLDELKGNIAQNMNQEHVQQMHQEIVRLKNSVQELTQTNKEYETLITTYVNSE